MVNEESITDKEKVYREFSSKIDEFLMGIISMDELYYWSKETKEHLSKKFDPDNLENLLMFGSLSEIQLVCEEDEPTIEYLKYLKDCLDGIDDYIHEYSLLQEKPGYIEVTENKAIKEVYARLKRGETDLSQEEARRLLQDTDEEGLIGAMTKEAIGIMSDRKREEEKVSLDGLLGYLEGKSGYSVEILFSRDRKSIITSVSFDDEKLFTTRFY